MRPNYAIVQPGKMPTYENKIVWCTLSKLIELNEILLNNIFENIDYLNRNNHILLAQNMIKLLPGACLIGSRNGKNKIYYYSDFYAGYLSIPHRQIVETCKRFEAPALRYYRIQKQLIKILPQFEIWEYRQNQWEQEKEQYKISIL